MFLPRHHYLCDCQRHLCGNTSGQRKVNVGIILNFGAIFLKKGANLKKTSFFTRKRHSNFGAKCYIQIPRYNGFSDFVVREK